MDRTKYEQIFSQESGRYLQELDGLLLRVEKESRNQALWGEIHGKLHSIKGMARGLSLDKITNLSHQMETWCKSYQEGQVKPDSASIQALYDGTDCIRQLVARKDIIESFEDQQWYSGLVTFFEKEPHRSGNETGLNVPVGTGPQKEAQVQSIKEVRVRYSLIEELMGLAQEIQLLGKSLPPLPPSSVSSGLKSWLDHCTFLMKAMYFRLASLRLMSVGDFAELFSKTVRNLAASYGKTVVFTVDGHDIEADITILERLREPLVHILRNSIAHGIEPPEERIAAAKPEQGSIFIKASSERDSLFIRVGDDGRGIDRTSITDYLRTREGLSDEAIQNLDEASLYNTILRSDFSSSSKTDDLAGRGIGMSVVAQAIGYLGGSMNIFSKPGEGTEFHIRLPLSMSVVQAITFTVDKFTLSIPTHQVAAIDRFSNLGPEQSARVIHLGRLLGLGTHQPLLHTIRMKSATAPGDDQGQTDQPLMGVDTIVGNRPLMVLPVGELLVTAGAFSGAGIMENGDISMMLDMDWVFERIAQRSAA